MFDTANYERRHKQKPHSSCTHKGSERDVQKTLLSHASEERNGTSWICCGSSMTAGFGGANGVLQPHGTTARLESTVFLSACT